MLTIFLAKFTEVERKKERGEGSVCELVGNSSAAAQIILKYFGTSLDTNLHGPEDLM